MLKAEAWADPSQYNSILSSKLSTTKPLLLNETNQCHKNQQIKTLRMDKWKVYESTNQNYTNGQMKTIRMDKWKQLYEWTIENYSN